MESVFSEFHRLNGTTWFYLSSMLCVPVFFRFSRLWSLRNLDLLALFLVVPGLLATSRVEKKLMDTVQHARQARTRGDAAPVALDGNWSRQTAQGYQWLFAVTGVLLVRTLADLALKRRPRVDANLNVAGLVCLGAWMLGFLIYEIATKDPDPAGQASAALAVAARAGLPAPPPDADPHAKPNPASTAFTAAVHLAADTVLQRWQDQPALARSDVAVGVARSAAILAHLLIAAGLVATGWKRFKNLEGGVGMATLYLLIPATAINAEKIDHLLPAAALVWAVFCTPWPYAAGALLAAASVFAFPIFLLPAWLGYYGRRGAGKCAIGFLAVAAVVAAGALASNVVRDFVEAWSGAVAWNPLRLGNTAHPLGFWTENTKFFRLPVFCLFFLFALGASFWPRGKTLGDVLGISVALLLGVQFWCPERGGAYVAWYLPMFLLLSFRPNLQFARFGADSQRIPA